MTKDTGENLYQQALVESVHHSLKTINSNIEKGGIRLSHSQALDLPYISARTLLADHLLVPTDYQANAGKTATLFNSSAYFPPNVLCHSIVPSFFNFTTQ